MKTDIIKDASLIVTILPATNVGTTYASKNSSLLVAFPILGKRILSNI
jgi:hypothetical protein